jgi:hypothetical protein
MAAEINPPIGYEVSAHVKVRGFSEIAVAGRLSKPRELAPRFQGSLLRPGPGSAVGADVNALSSRAVRSRDGAQEFIGRGEEVGRTLGAQ